jgi:phage shock protein C
MKNKLFRSRGDAMIGGVCGGLGGYLGIDATFVRLFFVLLTIGNGIGVLIYFLLWIMVPLEGNQRETSLHENVLSSSKEIADRTRAIGEDLRNIVRQSHSRPGVVLGSALVLLGLVYLLQNLRPSWLRWLDFNIVWPLLLILGGLALLMHRTRQD